MADSRRRVRAHRRARHADRWIGILVVVAALGAGLLAAHFGSPQPWERQSTTTPAPGRQGSP